jgi:prephenate dehydrogenase
MWTEILLENRSAVIDSCRDLARTVADLLEILENLDDQSLLSALTSAKDLRDSRYSPSPTSQLPPN